MRCSRHVSPGGGLGADPGQPGGIISLGWSGNTLVLPRTRSSLTADMDNDSRVSLPSATSCTWMISRCMSEVSETLSHSSGHEWARLDKCDQTVAKRGKVILTEGVELPEGRLADIQYSNKNLHTKWEPAVAKSLLKVRHEKPAEQYE